MGEFLRGRELLYFAMSCQETERNLWKEKQVRAKEKIVEFWRKRRGVVVNLGGFDSLSDFDHGLVHDTRNSKIEKSSILGWSYSEKLNENTFRLPHLSQRLSFLRITGKNVEKLELFFNDEFSPEVISISLLPNKTKRTFIVRLPFTIPVEKIPYSWIFIRVKGDAEEVEMRRDATPYDRESLMRTQKFFHPSIKSQRNGIDVSHGFLSFC